MNASGGENSATEKIRLTEYSHGAGCGCKLSPGVLSSVLRELTARPQGDLLVGNDKADDAAVLRISPDRAIISTTDFFMPIVDDPEDFGAIAATNALSDVYAMGGHPLLAIAILGWPVNKIPAEIAGLVLRGAEKVCRAAGIALAGGHSIDNPEPLFGLAVTGEVHPDHLKKNDGARPGDQLFLTKPLGIGILTTAEKKNLLRPEHAAAARASMLTLNAIGGRLGKISGVHAITDITGFGLFGHALEMAKASGTSFSLAPESVAVLPGVQTYLDQGSVPGGTDRNWKSYGDLISPDLHPWKNIFSDPQTSGGLLLAVSANSVPEMLSAFAAADLPAPPRIGTVKPRGKFPLEME